MAALIVVPYAGPRHPEVAAGAPGAEWHDVSADNHAYWRLLSDCWQRCLDDGVDLVVVEHDVVGRPDVFDGFGACPEPWCVHAYANICCPGCVEAWRNQLGLTRFRWSLIAACPDALASIPDVPFPLPDRSRPADRRDWHNLCDEIAGDKIAGVDQPTLRPGSVRGAGFTHHWHEPAVVHRPPYEQVA